MRAPFMLLVLIIGTAMLTLPLLAMGEPTPRVLVFLFSSVGADLIATIAVIYVTRRTK